MAGTLGGATFGTLGGAMSGMSTLGGGSAMVVVTSPLCHLAKMSRRSEMA